MNRKQFVLGLIAAIGLASAATPADTHTTSENDSAARAAAMRHKNSPVHRQLVYILVLPEMQPELGLSSQQVMALRRTKQEMVAKSNDLSNQIAERRKELDLLLSGDTSRTRTVKALMDKLAALHSELEYATFDSSVKMKALLDPRQRSKFDAIKPTDVRRILMSRENMVELETLMTRVGDEGMGVHVSDGAE